MTAIAQSSRFSPLAAGGDARAVAETWIDQLIAGRCTERALVSQVLMREREQPDVVWEVLGRLDQLHRRRRIANGVFARVKAHLQQEYLGYGKGAIPSRFLEPRSLENEPTIALPCLPEPAFMRLAPGDVLRKRYRVLSVLARGTDGATFEAMDEHVDEPGRLNRRVVMHMLSEQRSSELELVQRLYRLQALSHPAILRMLDFDEEDGALFYTTEWLKAKTLEALLQHEGRLRMERARSILGAVANALVHAHSRRIHHGDISLHQVLVTETGEVRLKGFVVEGRQLNASAAGDRLAFAQLAYEVLSRSGAPAARAAGTMDRMQPPAGVSADCWRLLMATLQNHEEMSGAELLTWFAGAGMPAPIPASAPAEAGADSWQQPAPRKGGWKTAASVLVALTALGGYLLLADGDNALRAGIASSTTPAQAAD